MTNTPTHWLTRLKAGSAVMSLRMVLVWLCVALGLQVNPASAHASFVRSEPVDGATVAVAPQRFTLTFSEAAAPLVLALVQPDGSRVALEDFALKDKDIVIAAPPGLGQGTHVLTWRVVSEDGHPVGGSVVFAIGAHTAPPVLEGAGAPLPVLALLWLGKIALYGGLFLGVGGVFAERWLVRGNAAAQWPVTMSLAAGLLGVPLLLGAQGADALGLPLNGVSLADAWIAGARTSLGPALLVASGALAIVVAARGARPSSGRWLALFGLLGVGVAIACTGHASSASPQWLTRPAVALHGVAAAFWIGALIPLRAAIREGGREGVLAVERFSRTIPGILAVLIGCGLALSVIQLERAQALWQTPYGQLLAVKLILVSCLLMIGAWNRWRLTAALKQGDAQARRNLVRSTGAELLVAVAIFAVVAGWRFTPPPRSLTAGETASVHLHGAKVMAHVTVSPNRAGPVAIRIAVMRQDGGVLNAKEVTTEISMIAARIEAIARKAKLSAVGEWTIGDLVIPRPGTWTLEVKVLVTDFEIETLTGDVTIR